MALAKAALAAGNRSVSPRTVAGPSPPSSPITPHPPVLVGAGERVPRLGGVALVHHEGPLELDHDLAALVDAATPHRDDAQARPRRGLARLEDLALGPERVALEDGMRQRDVRPRRVRGGVFAF